MQRQTLRCFWNQSRTSVRLGLLFSSSSCFAETMNPGVQKPHCAPPWAAQASCSGCRQSGLPTPSMVVTDAPSGRRRILYAHERTTLPSRMTLHAPHWPSPQPTLTPVSSSWPRSTSASVASGSTTRLRGMPLTMKCLLIMSLASVDLSVACCAGGHAALSVAGEWFALPCMGGWPPPLPFRRSGGATPPCRTGRRDTGIPGSRGTGRHGRAR